MRPQPRYAAEVLSHCCRKSERRGVLHEADSSYDCGLGLHVCRDRQACFPREAQGAQRAQPAGAQAPAEERLQKNPDRNAYFGEEHIHTRWSVDAWVWVTYHRAGRRA